MASGCPLNKRLELQNKLRGMGGVVLAYSGGVDSDFLLSVATGSGLKSLVAVTVESDFMTAGELDRAKKSAKKLGVELVVRRVEVLKDEALVINTARRCYFCKHLVFSLIKDVANERGISHFIHGVNVDDLGDYRPGLEAAAELGFSAPMAEVGFSKEEIRACAKEMGLSSWDLPSQSCLAARIPYGQRIAFDDLDRVARGGGLASGDGGGTDPTVAGALPRKYGPH